MNLKIFKPNYKEEKKMKQDLNYNIFGEYIKILHNKQVFMGGFCGSTDRQVRVLKNNISQIDYYERKHQINTIIKNYNHSLKHKRNKRARKISQCLSTEIPFNSEISSDILNKELPEVSQINKSLDNHYKINLRKNIGRNTNKSFSCIHNKSLPQITTITNKNTIEDICKQRNDLGVSINRHKVNVNELRDNLNKKIVNNAIKNIAKYDKTPFAKKKIVIDADDENYKFEKLKQLHKFYRRKESDFEKNKWKMFKKTKILSEQLLPKHSLHWIKLMMRKDW